MEVDIENTPKGEKQGKLIVLILVGAPASGKSTFCESVMKSSTRPWIRICQDTIGNGKVGTKTQCISSATSALKDGKSVFIDRCNLDKDQRADFANLSSSNVQVHAVVLDLPAKICIARIAKRTGHEGNLQGGKAALVVNKMLQKKELPKLSEGFFRITICQNESDVGNAIDKYTALGPLENLPSGFFGQKSSDTKVQLGIMKFLKKVEPTSIARSTGKDDEGSYDKISKEKNDEGSEKNATLKGHDNEVVVKDGSDIPTLAFPSLSTADFQFNLEKASEIIVEKVEEYVNKIGYARLVMVDLSHNSKILSLVKAKLAQKTIDPSKFLTFVGDITRLRSEGDLHCYVIANAANWRLKPGGGGVNAAIYAAAGSSLETLTKERATSLLPGHSIIVPLPPISPLYSKEGVTHVVHVLGPNMNPNRPNFLDHDYEKGCKILREAYSSLFESFASIVKNQESPDKDPKIQHINSGAQKIKRDDVCESERNKKSKAVHDEHKADVSDPSAIGNHYLKNGKDWGSWAQGLYRIAMDPEKYKNDVLEIQDDIVVLNDIYPKAQKHLLVLARSDGLDRLADVREEHLKLLKNMHDVGLKWAEKLISEDSLLVFRLGYHSVPSMRQLHLHLISQDFNSKHLKNKKHWNSFNTAFFRDSVDVINDVVNHGKASLNNDESLLSMELRCHRCRSAHPNIPRLKSHISNCKYSFPSSLLQNDRLVRATNEPGTES